MSQENQVAAELSNNTAGVTNSSVDLNQVLSDAVAPTTDMPTSTEENVTNVSEVSQQSQTVSEVEQAPAKELQECLVPNTSVGGFDSKPVKRVDPNVMFYQYRVNGFNITARVAPNRTIDFMFDRPEASIITPDEASTHVYDSQLYDIVAYLADLYAQDENNKVGIEQLVKDLNSEATGAAITGVLLNAPFNFTMNIKPLLTAIKAAEAGVDPVVVSLLQIKLLSSEPLPEGLCKVVRVHSALSTAFYQQINELILEGYRDAAGMDKDASVTLEDVKADYLSKLPGGNTPKTAAKESQSAVAKKPKEPKAAQNNAVPAADSSQQRQPKTNPVGQEPRRERQDSMGGTSTRELERMIHAVARNTGEINDNLVSQLRTIQSQQADILEQQKQILDDNQTLFVVLNLLTKALGVGK